MVSRVAAVLAAWAACIGAAPAATSPIVLPGENLPDAVTALGALDLVSGFGVSAERDVAVVASPSARSPGRSALRIARAAGVEEIELPGAVRALVVSADGAHAFAICFETDRKGNPRRTSLLRIDLASRRVQSGLALPSSARGLAFGAGGTSLLVAARDEIRTFLLPQLTSGPLFRVPGDNAAVAALSGTSRVLAAQGQELVLVDLLGAQDRDGLEMIERVHADAPLHTLIASPDDPVALALAEGGLAFDVSTEPLRLLPRAGAIAASWPGTPAPAPPLPAVAAQTDEGAAVSSAAVGAAAVAEAPVPSAPPSPAQAEPQSSAPVQEMPQPQASPAPEPSAVPEPPPPPKQETVVPAVPSAPSEAQEAPPPLEPGSVIGTVGGPARELAIAVVALGPDNVLKEAARTATDASGRFRFTGLLPGSYRLVAAGEGGRVLVCEPPFVTIRLVPGGSVEAPPLGVLKGY